VGFHQKKAWRGNAQADRKMMKGQNKALPQYPGRLF